MQKAASTVVIFVMSLFSLFAQKENFGIITYTAPPGYEVIKNDNAWTYYKEDKATGAYCNIFIYKLMPGQGNVHRDFNNSWDGLMQKPFKITATPVLQPEAVLKGWKFIIGTATYKENGVSALAMATTFSGENKLQTIVILSNSDTYKTDIENFIASVDVAKEIAGISSAANQNANSNSSVADNSIAGIWCYSDRQKMAATFATIFAAFNRGYKFNPDGTYQYYNKVYLRGNTKLIFQYETGTWTVNGNQLTIKPAKGQNEEWSKKGKDADLMGEDWGTRLKVTSRKMETITYTFEKRIFPIDKTTHLMLSYDKLTARDADYNYDKDLHLWYYNPQPPNEKDFPPGFDKSGWYSVSPLSSSNTVNPGSQKANNAATSNIKCNLWMAHKLSLNGKLGDMSFQYIVISSDNRCLYHFPEKGLLNIEQEYAGSDSWGTVTDKGSMLSLSNKYGKMDLYKRTTGMGRYADSKPSDYYKKCKPVDGLRIEGAYTPDVSLYTKKNNAIDKAVDDPGKRPIIFFRKDGTYINEGIAFSNITMGDDFALGKGTYEIKDFSLVLTTQSGRKLQTSFAAILDANPATSTDGYIINQNLFYKLDASVQPH